MTRRLLVYTVALILFVLLVSAGAGLLALHDATNRDAWWRTSIALIGFGALLATCATFVASVQTQWRLKSWDVRMSFQNRYDTVEYDFRPKVSEAKSDEERSRLGRDYYARFWVLQQEQFQAWLDGFIDDRTFSYWLRLRRNAYLNDNKVGGFSYKDGSKTAIAALGDDDFTTFINHAHEDSAAKALSYGRQLSRKQAMMNTF